MCGLKILEMLAWHIPLTGLIIISQKRPKLTQPNFLQMFSSNVSSYSENGYNRKITTITPDIKVTFKITRNTVGALNLELFGNIKIGTLNLAKKII